MNSINNRKKYIKKLIMKNREFCKAPNWEEMPAYEDWEPDQSKGIDQPSPQKEIPLRVETINLLYPQDFQGSFSITLYDAIKNRKSRRKFTNEFLTLEELSFLLWATQGIKNLEEDKRHGQKKAIRKTVPSGGSRHPFETYLIVNRVENVRPGIYRYLFLENKLLFISEIEGNGEELLSELTMGQNFVGKSAVFFIWSVIPYRTEWRYSIISYKDILVEAGHICQNLYLSCEASNLGTCAILAYDQGRIDNLLELDGIEEFVIYVAPVGKVK